MTPPRRDQSEIPRAIEEVLEALEGHAELSPATTVRLEAIFRSVLRAYGQSTVDGKALEETLVRIQGCAKSLPQEGNAEATLMAMELHALAALLTVESAPARRPAWVPPPLGSPAPPARPSSLAAPPLAAPAPSPRRLSISIPPIAAPPPPPAAPFPFATPPYPPAAPFPLAAPPPLAPAPRPAAPAPIVAPLPSAPLPIPRDEPARPAAPGRSRWSNVVPRAVLDRLADLVGRRARVLADPLSLFGALGAVDGQMEDALWSARFLGDPMCLVAEAALADPQGENEDAAAAPMPPSPACPRPPERPTA